MEGRSSECRELILHGLINTHTALYNVSKCGDPVKAIISGGSSICIGIPSTKLMDQVGESTQVPDICSRIFELTEGFGLFVQQQPQIRTAVPKDEIRWAVTGLFCQYFQKENEDGLTFPADALLWLEKSFGVKMWHKYNSGSGLLSRPPELERNSKKEMLASGAVLGWLDCSLWPILASIQGPETGGDDAAGAICGELELCYSSLRELTIAVSNKADNVQAMRELETVKGSLDKWARRLVAEDGRSE